MHDTSVKTWNFTEQADIPPNSVRTLKYVAGWSILSMMRQLKARNRLKERTKFSLFKKNITLNGVTKPSEDYYKFVHKACRLFFPYITQKRVHYPYLVNKIVKSLLLNEELNTHFTVIFAGTQEEVYFVLQILYTKLVKVFFGMCLIINVDVSAW